LIGVLLLPLLVVPAIRRMLRPSEQQLVLVSAAVFACWVAFLSASSKQAWRYVIAVAPFCYVVGVLVLCAVGRQCRAAQIPLLVLVLCQCGAAIQSYPAWDLYQSSFASVLDTGVRKKLVRVRSGQQEALSFLIREAKQEQREVFVSVLGDGDVFQREAARSFGADKKLLRIGYLPEYASDYLLVQSAFEVTDPQWARHTSSEPVFRFVSDYGAGIFIYHLRDGELPREVSLPIQKIRLDKGSLMKVNGVEELQLEPSKAEAGYVVAFPTGYRVTGAHSRFEFQVGDFHGGKGLSQAKPTDPLAPVARFDITRECSRTVTQSELAVGMKPIVVSCVHATPRRVFPRVYWFGAVPVSLIGVSVRVSDQE
jgi:hypothetical protein